MDGFPLHLASYDQPPPKQERRGMFNLRIQDLNLLTIFEGISDRRWMPCARSRQRRAGFDPGTSLK
jgi:hypothetical protein